MRRSLLALVLLVLLSVMMSGADADTPTADMKVYLPLVAKNAPLPEGLHIVSDSTSYGDFPYWEYVYGHIENRTTMPLYSVVLGMDVRNTNCFETDPCEVSDFTEQITPAFAATLPNQINPFRTDAYMQYKTYYSLGALRVFDARRNPPDEQDYEALTIVRVGRDESDPSIVRGVARNDGERVLRDARVVIYVPDACSWTETTLDSTTLAPSQEVAFQVETGCRTNTFSAVGQGVVAD